MNNETEFLSVCNVVLSIRNNFDTDYNEIFIGNLVMEQTIAFITIIITANKINVKL